MAEPLGDVATRVLFENAHVKVWEMTLAPGEASPLHRHDRPYVRGTVMRTTLFVATWLAFCGLLMACGPVPGGRLSGTITPAPSDWSTIVPDKRFCEIESRPSDPHSIQLECFRFGDGLYVNSHRWALATWWPVTSWAAIWIDRPDVRVRIGPAMYELRATRVTDAAERTAVLNHRGYAPPPAGIVVFRFVPRV